MLRQFPYERVAGLLNQHNGLSMREVANRRAKYGDNNIIDTPEGSGWRELIKDTIRDPMLWFLLVTSALFAVVGDVKEAIILMFAIVPLAGMDMFMHRRTQASTASLGGRLATHAHVIRDDQQAVIASRDIVCGDLVTLGPNDYLPADGIVVDALDVQIDESALTGEAFPAHKKPYRPAPNPNGAIGTIPLEVERWGFAGTRMLTGKAQLRVVYTGNETYYGEIVQSALHGKNAKTPLQAAIVNLVKVLVSAAAIMCLVLALVRWYQGFGLLDAFISATTLAVAALPEEFPLTFTFFLGVGVYRLAKRKALVRRAVAVENIGRVTTVCSDKTGTLTLGRLTLAGVYPAAPYTSAQLLECARLASRANSGDPLDLAIVDATPNTPTDVHCLATFPFTEDRKKETVLLRRSTGEDTAIVKGAPEAVFEQCRLSNQTRVKLTEVVNQLSDNGHKIIACAKRRMGEDVSLDAEPTKDFDYIGLLAFEDPIRDGVAEAVQFCHQNDIHVVMVTGDHPLTARAVAKNIGLGEGEPRVATAEDIEQRTGDDPLHALRKMDVIARSIPSQKLRFVQQLQACGEIVAVTGDGVNDVPALQAADVGIAMGERGTPAAREVSAIVLLDDNFRTLVRAIAEGAQLFHNLRMSFAYLLLVHIALIVSAALIPLMGFPLLYLPIHIVWLELIIHPSALLAFQQFPDGGLTGTLRGTETDAFFSRYEWTLILTAGLLFTSAVIGGYILSLRELQDVEHARAMALAVFFLTSAAITAVLSQLSTTPARFVVAGTALSALLLVQVPLLADITHLQPLHWSDWGIALLASAASASILSFWQSNREGTAGPTVNPAG